MLSVVRANPMADGEMAIPKDFGAAIRARRIAMEMNQTQLGLRVGVTQGAISLIENGVSGSSRVLLAICRALDMDPPSFLTHAEDERWLEAGQELRRSDPTRFRVMLDTVESLAEAASSPRKGDGDEPNH